MELKKVNLKFSMLFFVLVMAVSFLLGSGFVKVAAKENTSLLPGYSIYENDGIDPVYSIQKHNENEISAKFGGNIFPYPFTEDGWNKMGRIMKTEPVKREDFESLEVEFTPTEIAGFGDGENPVDTWFAIALMDKPEYFKGGPSDNSGVVFLFRPQSEYTPVQIMSVNNTGMSLLGVAELTSVLAGEEGTRMALSFEKSDDDTLPNRDNIAFPVIQGVSDKGEVITAAHAFSMNIKDYFPSGNIYIFMGASNPTGTKSGFIINNINGKTPLNNQEVENSIISDKTEGGEDKFPVPELPEEKYTATSDTITVCALEGCEYKLGQYGLEQDSNIFMGLDPDTEYMVFVRKKATADKKASDWVSFTARTAVLTKHPTPSTPTCTATKDKITVVAVSGAEYKLGEDGQWQDSNIFNGLSPDTEYRVYLRIKASDGLEASDTVYVDIKTKKDVVEPEKPTQESGCGNSIYSEAIVGSAFILMMGAVILAMKRRKIK